MGFVLTKLMKATQAFGRRDEGTASVEALFWIPAFVAVFSLMADASMMYHYEARVLRIVQDANRNLSNTRFDDGASVEAEIKTRLKAIGVTPKSVTATVDSVYDTDLKKDRNNAVITEVVLRVIDDMTRPNGVIGTPDGKTLYVADHGGGKTWSCLSPKSS